MKFASPHELGSWAQSNNVLRASFHADGTLRTVDFMPSVPDDAVDAADIDGKGSPQKAAVRKALQILAGGKQGE